MISALSCSRETFSGTDSQSQGSVLISLKRDDRTVIAHTKSGDVLPPVAEDFKIEIFNSSATRLYKKPYTEAKDETIRLNAGNYRILASFGDTLGAGFAKPYYKADSIFTVHGFAENGGKPDFVKVTARLSNVKASVVFGQTLKSQYSDYFAVLRHSSYPLKSVKFIKDETRSGYIPGGKLYLEVYAQLSGTGTMDGGQDKLVYFKSEPMDFLPNDFVTFTVDTKAREGELSLDVVVDNSVELLESAFTVPAQQLPTDAPSFSYNGVSSDVFTASYPAGPGAAGEKMIFSFMAKEGIASVRLDTDSEVLTGAGFPASADLSSPGTQQDALDAFGLKWVAGTSYRLGYVDFTGIAEYLSLNAPLNPSSPVTATFTVSVTDNIGKVSSALFKLQGVPVQTTVTAKDTDIWGWKIAASEAVVANLDQINPATDVKLQYSLDGISWEEVSASSITGNKILFPEISPLQAGRTYLLRTKFNNDPNNVSSPSRITTETPLQIDNNGFEQITQNTFKTTVTGGGWFGIPSSYDVVWWNLAGSGAAQWWAHNSLKTIVTDCAATYPDYKSYPTVAVTSTSPYQGSRCLVIATISINDVASEIVYGTPYAGELFLGTDNGQNEGAWARASEGHGFTSRPKALRFAFKFDSYGKSPFVVNLRVCDASGNVIASAVKKDVTTSVSAWTLMEIPLNYSVTDAKAAGIYLDFLSEESVSGSRKTVVSTESGSHTLHAGNILYLDNVELLYQ